MPDVTTPADINAALQQIRDSLPGIPRDFVGQRAAGMKICTVDEAMQWMENVARAANNTSRLPVTTTSERHPDGTLTIRVTPQ